jgi:hypothetical protein
LILKTQSGGNAEIFAHCSRKNKAGAYSYAPAVYPDFLPDAQGNTIFQRV